MNLIQRITITILILTVFYLITMAHDVHKATEKGDPAADMNSRDRMNRTPLHNAAVTGNSQLLARLIRLDADPNTRDIYGSTPLHEAVLHEHKDTVSILISKGANMNSCRPDGTTPLHIARERGNKGITALLLKEGAQDKPKVFPELTGDYLGQKPPG